jgi:protein subunit release factor B
VIRQEKITELEKRMQKLGIDESDLQEKFIIGSGRGGQNLQKTSSCVWLKHTPTGIEVKCQKARTRELNRYYARARLCDKIDEQINQEKSKKQMEIEKIRRQKRRRTRRQKEKMLEDKRQRSSLKKSRQPPTNND